MHQLVIVIAKYVVVVPVISYIILVAYRRRHLKELVIYSLLSLAIGIILVKLATTLHSDPRPFVRDGIKPYFVSSTDNGFPSDHTTFSSLIAFVIFKYDKRAGLALSAIAVLIGTARVISGVHHGQDVIAGVLIAALSAYLAKLLVTVIMRKAGTGSNLVAEK